MSYQSPYLNNSVEDPRANTRPQGVPPNHARVNPIVQTWTDPSRQSAKVEMQKPCFACGSINIDPAQPDYRLDNSSHGSAEPDDVSEDGSDDEDLAPELALKVTATNLAAVLRLNSAVIYLNELVETYISFDKIYPCGK